MHQSPAEVMEWDQDIPPLLYDDEVVNGTIHDMQGWDGILFILNLGVTDIVADLLIESDDAVGFSSATAITGAALTQLTATDDLNVYGIDVYRPDERFVRSELTVGDGVAGANIGVTAIKYRGTGRFPITQLLGELVKVAQN